MYPFEVVMCPPLTNCGTTMPTHAYVCTVNYVLTSTLCLLFLYTGMMEVSQLWINVGLLSNEPVN